MSKGKNVSEYELVRLLCDELSARMEECLAAASTTKVSAGQDVGYFMSSMLLPFAELLRDNKLVKKDFIATAKMAANLAWASVEGYDGHDA